MATTRAATKRASADVALRAQSGAKHVVHLFNGLNDGDISAIMAAAVVRRFGKGQFIVRADDPGTRLFLLKTGLVNYNRVTPEGQEVLIIRLSPGDTFGLGTLLPKPIVYIGTAKVIREAELYVWEHAWVRHFARKHPLLAENALRITLEYIRLYSDRHLALVSGNAEDRLSHMLVLLGIRTGQWRAKGIEIQITNEHLASLADVGYYTTSRLLNKWERQGAVEKSRGKVLVLCPEKILRSKIKGTPLQHQLCHATRNVHS